MTRLVVTGVGVVAPSGVGVEEHWATLLRGEARVGAVTGFDPDAYVDSRLKVQTDRWTWMSLAATTMALADAGYDPAEHDPFATSVFLASGSGGNEFGQREIQSLWSRGRKAVGAYQSIAWFYAASSGQVSIREGIKGPSGVVVSEAAGGLDSIGWARRAVRRGTPAVLVGGTEAGLSPYAMVCQATGGRLSATTYRPFDPAADGHVVGEGGAVLLVEELDAALGRGVRRIWGEVAGYAATHDGADAADGSQYTRAVSLALADAGVTPDEVDLVIADAAAVPALDAQEADMIMRTFGGRRVPVTAPAALTGRLMAGGSALDVATALLAIRDGVAPGSGPVDGPAYGLDLVREARAMPIDTVLVAARGEGGFNSSLVLKRYEGVEQR